MEESIIVVIMIFSILLYYVLVRIWFKIDAILTELKKKNKERSMYD